MPTPRKGQKKSEFISQCVSKVTKEGKTPEQALGQCYGMWDQKKKKAGASIKVGKGEEIILTSEE